VTGVRQWFFALVGKAKTLSGRSLLVVSFPCSV
jgi:hypothetical protein